MKSSWSPLFAALALIAGGCEFPFGVEGNCPDWVVPGLSVTITDSITSDPLPDAVAWAVDGTFVDTLSGTVGGRFTGAVERPGTYDVFVEHPGYLNWQEVGIRVKDGKCNVQTRSFDARLRPSN